MPTYNVLIDLYFRRSLSGEYYRTPEEYLEDVDEDYRVDPSYIKLLVNEPDPTSEEVDAFMNQSTNIGRVAGGYPATPDAPLMYEDYVYCIAADWDVSDIKYLPGGKISFKVTTEDDGPTVERSLLNQSLEDGMYGGWPLCTGIYPSRMLYSECGVHVVDEDKYGYSLAELGVIDYRKAENISVVLH